MEVSHAQMGLAEWKALAAAGEAPAGALLRKQYVPDSIKAEDGDSRRIEFTISTGAVDRDRDTLKADGWRLDAYRQNPVVLWAHMSRDLPIGRAESVRVAGGALKARAEFVRGEDYPFADTVYRLLRGGFLKATSVGFIPTFEKAKYDQERGGFDFGEQELLEFSVVPVPANPEALMDAKAAGVDVAPLRAWAERVLDETGDEPGLWVPKAQALAAFKALAEPQVTVPADTFGAQLAAGLKAELEKRGRVLSQMNEDRIVRARDGAEACMAALDEVMSSLPAPVEEAPKAAKEPAALYLVPDTTMRVGQELMQVDPKDLAAAVGAAVRAAVGAEIRRHTGRLD